MTETPSLTFVENDPAFTDSFKCSPETRQHIDQIRAWQIAKNLSDAAFCKRLPINQTVWSKILSSKYAGDTDGQIARLVPAWRSLVEELKHEAQHAPFSRPSFEFATFAAAKSAMSKAMSLASQGQQDKLVWYVADTGWGKDVLSTMIRGQYGGSQILCRKSWRHSYYALLKDMGGQLGIEEKKLGSGAHAAESAVLEFLKKNPRPLIFNETEFVGANGLGLIKSILNETSCSVLILCVPDTYAEFCRRGGTDMQQCRRRTVGVVRPGKITPSEAAKFINHAWPNMVDANKKDQEAQDARVMAKDLADAANHFGGWAMCWRVVEHLRDNPERPTLEEFKQAIPLVREIMNA